MSWQKYMARLATIQAILMVYVALGFAYSLTTPAFETPDELAHFAYIRRLVDGRGFPVAPLVVADDAPAQESSQPPLYYISAAVAVRLAAPDTSDFSAVVRRNPAFPYIFGTVHNDNKNLLIHQRLEIFPYEGTLRALHVARWVTLLFGALTVWGTYCLGREMFPQRPAIGLLAAALVAFTPQFLFISGAASNDLAAAAFSAISLWAAVRIMQRGFNARRAIALGFALGLAALSKASASALIPLCLLAVLVVNQVPSTVGTRVKWALLVAACAMLLAGPWYVRTWITFGDLLGTSTHMAMSWARPVPLAFFDAVTKLPDAWMSYWLAFGWGNILAPDWIYWLLDGLLLIGLVGAIAWWWGARRDSTQRIERASGLLLGVWTLVIVAALVRWIQLLNAAIGRLLFPAMAALSILLIVGWWHWARRTWLVAVIPLTLLVLSIAALPLIMTTAYAQPAVLTADELAQQRGQPLDIRYGDVARLVRLDVPHDRWPQPGEGLVLNMCWEPLKQDDRQLLVLLQIIGENDRLWFSRRTVPGLGNYPIGEWQPGGLFCDPVHVQIDDQTPPGLYQVEVVLIDQDTRQRLPAYAADGSRLSTDFLDRIKIAPQAYATPAIEKPLKHRLSDQFELIGYNLDRTVVSPGEAIGLRLYWKALRRPEADYTVFVQVRDTENHIVAQKDGAPQQGAYPTSFWDAGEVVIDNRMIEIPADAPVGKYPIRVGMYLPADGSRLPIDGKAAVTEVTLPVEIEIR
jgi:4-amino-4-deoxy-L-arabinose transferase-like glycosyltransferase